MEETLKKVASAPKKKKKRPMNMFQATTWALLFVSLWGVVMTYYSFGLTHAIYAVKMLVVAVAVAFLVHIGYYMVVDCMEKKEFPAFKNRITDNWKKVKRGTPEITGLIVALCFQTATPLWVVAIAAFLAELVGKLIWGGFGKNKLNPAAVGFVLTSLVFGYYQAMPVVDNGYVTDVYTDATADATADATGEATPYGLYYWDAVSDATTTPTPLSAVAVNGWYVTETRYEQFRDDFGGFGPLLLGTFSGPMAEISRLASIIALAFMVWKKAVKWTIPLVYTGTVAVIAFVVGMIHGFPMTYPLIHVLNGGVIFAAVFMATDPVTIPKNPHGKVIFAILLGALTMTLRFRLMSYPEGVMFSILIMNMFAGYINDKASKIAKAPANRQWLVYGVVGAVSVALVTILALTLPY